MESVGASWKLASSQISWLIFVETLAHREGDRVGEGQNRLPSRLRLLPQPPQPPRSALPREYAAALGYSALQRCVQRVGAFLYRILPLPKHASIRPRAIVRRILRDR